MIHEETDASVRITKHAKQRSKERVGLNQASLERLLPRIISEGRRSRDFAGSFQRYLNSLHHLHSRGRHKDIVVYSLQIYILIDNRVITILQVPQKYIKVVTNKAKDGNDEEREESFQKIRKRSRCNT